MSEMNHTVIPCPFCGQKLRIPTDRAGLKLTCPKCRYKWNWFARPVETAKSNQHAMSPALLFRESDEFYQQLSKMLRTEDPFTVQTPYTSYTELPERLKKIVKSKPREAPNLTLRTRECALRRRRSSYYHLHSPWSVKPTQ
jgi:phage FluMu protein Com